MNKHDLKLLREELIGVEVFVDSNIKGTIIDETKNLFTIKTIDKTIKIIKKTHKFEFIFPDRHIKVDGIILAVKPEDRIKIQQKNIKKFL